MSNSTASPVGHPQASAWRFFWHLLQMILSMAVGMAIFVALFSALLSPTGYLALQTQTPLLWFAGMAVSMTVPMVAWMRYYQRHSWRQCVEMTVAMLFPSAPVAALVQFGVTAEPWFVARTLAHSTHAAMLIGMTTWMLYRRNEYAASANDSKASCCSDHTGSEGRYKSLPSRENAET